MIFLKKKHVIPKQGGGGGSPIWEKFPHFPVFFGGSVPYLLFEVCDWLNLYFLIFAEWWCWGQWHIVLLWPLPDIGFPASLIYSFNVGLSFAPISERWSGSCGNMYKCALNLLFRSTATPLASFNSSIHRDFFRFLLGVECLLSLFIFDALPALPCPVGQQGGNLVEYWLNGSFPV